MALRHFHGPGAEPPEAGGKMCLQARPSIHKRLNNCFWNAKNS